MRTENNNQLRINNSNFIHTCIICVAVCNFIEAVDAILVDDSYELPSPVAYSCRKAAELSIFFPQPAKFST